MILDMGPILSGQTNKLEFDYMLKPATLRGVDFDNEAHVTGQVVDSAGYIRLKAKAYLAYTAECDRCLATLSDKLTIDFERTVVNAGTLTDEQLEDDIDEYVVIESGKLDINEQLNEAIIMDFPNKLLCSEDCAGLCSKCGKALSAGDCGCPKKEIDPRLAILATLLEDDKT